MRGRGWIVAGGVLAAVGVALWLAVRDGSRSAPGQQAHDAGAVVLPGVAPTLQGVGPAPRAGTDPGAAGATDAPASAATAQEEHGEHVVLVGRVVDERRRPVAGATVTSTREGRDLGTTRTDADGSFRLPAGPRSDDEVLVLVLARHADRGAHRVVHIPPGGPREERLTGLVLGPLHALDVIVRHRGQPVAGSVVVARPADETGPVAPLVTGTTGATGAVRLTGLTALRLRLFAVGPGTGRSFQELSLPADGPVQVDLPDDRRATITVLRADTDEPLAGAAVHLAGEGTWPFPSGSDALPPFGPLRTDAAGRVQVAGLPAGHVRVVAWAPGWTLPNAGWRIEPGVLRPDATDLTLRLQAGRTLRFPLKAGGVAAPDDGTPLELVRYQPVARYPVVAPRARIEDDHVVIEAFPPGFDVGHVAAPDGSWAPWAAPLVGDVGEPVTFQRAHDVAVGLAWPDGTPAVGQHVQLALAPRGARGPLPTDATGTVVFPRCQARTAHVYWADAEAFSRRYLGEVDLRAPPGTLQVTVGRPLEMVVQVRVDGEACLPRSFEVSLVDPGNDTPSVHPQPVHPLDLEEDAAAGELRLSCPALPMGGAPTVAIQAEGLPPARGVPVLGEDGVWRAQVHLTRSTPLRVRVLPPADGRYYLCVERWSAEREAWLDTMSEAAFQGGVRGVDHVHVFAGYTRGRYRLHDLHSGLRGAPFELGGGGGEVALDFDLAQVVTVRGRVTVPDGERVAFATFSARIGDEPPSFNQRPLPVDADGGFDVRAPRGARVAVVVEHPALRGPRPAPSFVVGTDDIVVPLARGPELHFRIEGRTGSSVPPDPRIRSIGFGGLGVRIVPTGTPFDEAPPLRTLADEGLFRCAVETPATYDVRVEQPGLVPVDLLGVKVGSGATDLGTLHLLRGATLEVRLHRGKHPLPSSPLITATFLGERPYVVRAWDLQPGSPPFLATSGLAAGSFHVAVGTLDAEAEVLFEQTVTSDGATPLVLDAHLP